MTLITPIPLTTLNSGSLPSESFTFSGGETIVGVIPEVETKVTLQIKFPLGDWVDTDIFFTADGVKAFNAPAGILGRLALSRAGAGQVGLKDGFVVASINIKGV